jgi:hypothetical protein
LRITGESFRQPATSNLRFCVVFGRARVLREDMQDIRDAERLNDGEGAEPASVSAFLRALRLGPGRRCRQRTQETPDQLGNPGGACVSGGRPTKWCGGPWSERKPVSLPESEESACHMQENGPQQR